METMKALAQCFFALGNPNRLSIFAVLLRNGRSTMQKEIIEEFKVTRQGTPTQSAVSDGLAVLCEAGLVQRHRSGFLAVPDALRGTVDGLINQDRQQAG